MNERIKRLAYAAEYWTKTLEDKTKYQEYFITVFAEMIVNECCDIFVELRTRPADLAVKDVKKHFGFEE